MRRSNREVTGFDDKVEIIRNCDVCRLAMNGEEVPYILPLNFGMEVVDGKVVLYFHGAKEGTKYEYLRKNPLVAFEMDCDHELLFVHERKYCTMIYSSVIGKGLVEIVPDEEKIHGLNLLLEHYHPGGFPLNMDSVPETLVMKMTVLEMTAKSNRSKKSEIG